MLHSLRGSVGIVTLLRYGHNYIILAFQKFFHSYAPFIRLPTSSPGQTKYICCYCFYCPDLSFCDIPPVPAIIISTQTDLPIAGSLQLYLGTLFGTPHPLHGLCLGHTGIFTVTTTAKYTRRACELFVSVDTPQILYQSPPLI